MTRVGWFCVFVAFGVFVWAPRSGVSLVVYACFVLVACADRLLIVMQKS